MPTLFQQMEKKALFVFRMDGETTLVLPHPGDKTKVVECSGSTDDMAALAAQTTLDRFATYGTKGRKFCC